MTIQRCALFLNTLRQSITPPIQTACRHASGSASAGPDFEVTVTISSRVAIVKLDREHAMNSLNVPVLNRLLEVIESFQSTERSLSAMILTGQGSRAFISGADIRMFAQDRTPREILDILLLARRVTTALERAPFTTIAAMNGATLGGGLELALACDLRYAHPGVRLGLPESSLGLIPGCGGTQRLPRLVGEGVAKEMMLTGDPISAERAKELGLVNALFPEGDLIADTLAIAHKIANRPLQSVQAIKTAVQEGRPHQGEPEFTLPEEVKRHNFPLERGEGFEIDGFLKCFQTEESKQRVCAFLEKTERKRS